MARRPNKHQRRTRPLSPTFGHAEQKADGDWVVKTQVAGTSQKTYLCPGCHQSILPGASHIVAWPREPRLASTSAVEDRRHWHTACWRRKR